MLACWACLPGRAPRATKGARDRGRGLVPKLNPPLLKAALPCFAPQHPSSPHDALSPTLAAGQGQACRRTHPSTLANPVHACHDEGQGNLPTTPTAKPEVITKHIPAAQTQRPSPPTIPPQQATNCCSAPRNT